MAVALKANAEAIKSAPLPFDPASIKPPHGQMDGSGKFSPNLYRWIAKRGRQFCGRGLEHHPLVYRASDGALWIGHFDERGWFSGARLMRVLCNGARNEIWAVMPKDCKGWKLVKNFWRDYRRIGRCAIDKRHTVYFQNNDSRWSVKGNTRECLWCGDMKQKLHRHTEVKRIKHETWRAA